MRKIFVIFAFILAAFFGFEYTKAAFTTSAKAINNTFSTALIFPSITPVPTTSPLPTATPSFSVNPCPSGFEISNSGVNSNNQIIIECIRITNTNQTNNTNINNNINTSTNTGGNSGDNITSGNSTTTVNVINSSGINSLP